MSRSHVIRVALVILFLASSVWADTEGQEPLVNEPLAADTLAFPAVQEMAPDELSFLTDLFAVQLEDLSARLAPKSLSSGCFYACYDLQDSAQFCPPGMNFAFEATGSVYRCYLVGGGTCISSGCSAHISSCSGFAAHCNGGGGF